MAALLVLLVAYFFPAVVATVRGHNQSNAIVVLNVFLGWTFLGWVVALVWACTSDVIAPQSLQTSVAHSAPVPAALPPPQPPSEAASPLPLPSFVIWEVVFALMGGFILVWMFGWPAPLSSPPPQSPPVTPPRTEWFVEKEKSPVDDSQNVSIWRNAATEVQGWLERARPSLTLRCKEQKVDVIINTGVMSQSGDLYTAKHTAKITLRFDAEKAGVYDATQSTDYRALYVRDPVQLIRKMLKHDTLRLQFTPHNAGPAVTTFDLRGLSDVVGELQQACHWR